LVSQSKQKLRAGQAASGMALLLQLIDLGIVSRQTIEANFEAMNNQDAANEWRETLWR